MDNQSGQNKNRIIDVTADHVGDGFQILSANKPRDDKGEPVKQGGNIIVGKEVIIGFIFRIFVTVFLFLYGLKIVILENEVSRTFKPWWLFKLVGVGLIFLSFYLLYNLFSKKVSKEIYLYWCLGFIFTLIAIIIDSLNEGVILKAIFLAFSF